MAGRQNILLATLMFTPLVIILAFLVILVENRGIGQGLDGEDEFWPDGEDEDEFLMPPGSRSREYLSHRRPVERDISDVDSSLGSPRPRYSGM